MNWMKLSCRIVALTTILLTVGGLVMLKGSWATVGDLFSTIVSERRYTVADRVESYGHTARTSLSADFQKAGVSYPPTSLVMAGFKKERVLEIYAGDRSQSHRFIRSYPILAASGETGPKLREGDMQVPEGIYAIESLNPNSRFHLSLRVNYPNAFDRAQAAREERTNLGGDIMIHGSRFSIGCLAIGDSAIEELFVLAADTGIQNIEVLLAPVDFRKRELEQQKIKNLPSWTPSLYELISKRLRTLSEHDESQR